MMAQVENTPDGYIVSAYLTAPDGSRRWCRLVNFGEREGDARLYRDKCVPRLRRINFEHLVKSFDVTDHYRLTFNGRLWRTNKTPYIKYA